MSTKDKTINGSVPHPDHGSWENFIEKHCELRAEVYGVKHYGRTNCNYIVFPTGEMVQNFGYHGWVMMNRVRDKGWVIVLEEIKQDVRVLKSLIKSLTP